MNLSFTRSRLDQLDVLTALSKSTFIAAFEKDNNPEDFHAYMNSAFSNDAIKKQLLNPNSSFYFVHLNNDLVGYFKLNESSAQNVLFVASSIELERIYVLNDFQGKHIGRYMLEKIIEISKSKSVSFLWLGVWDKNLSAIRFYERYGFKPFNSHPFYIGNEKQIDLLMRLDFV